MKWIETKREYDIDEHGASHEKRVQFETQKRSLFGLTFDNVISILNLGTVVTAIILALFQVSSYRSEQENRQRADSTALAHYRDDQLEHARETEATQNRFERQRLDRQDEIATQITTVVKLADRIHEGQLARDLINDNTVVFADVMSNMQLLTIREITSVEFTDAVRLAETRLRTRLSLTTDNVVFDSAYSSFIMSAKQYRLHLELSSAVDRMQNADSTFIQLLNSDQGDFPDRIEEFKTSIRQIYSKLPDVLTSTRKILRLRREYRWDGVGLGYEIYKAAQDIASDWDLNYCDEENLCFAIYSFPEAAGVFVDQLSRSKRDWYRNDLMYGRFTNLRSHKFHNAVRNTADVTEKLLRAMKDDLERQTRFISSRMYELNKARLQRGQIH